MAHKAFRIVCLGIFVLMLAIPSLAQNTKGDKPSPTNRETRFKTPKKSGHKTKPARRIKERADKPGRQTALPPGQTKGGDKPGRPIRPLYQKSQPSDKQKAWKGDITRRRIKPRSSANRAWNVYPQPGTTNYTSRTLKRNLRDSDNPHVRRVRRILQQHERARARPGRPIRPVYTNKKPRHREKAWSGDITGRRIRSRTSENRGLSQERSAAIAPGQTRPKVHASSPLAGRQHERARNYSYRKFYVNNKSQKPPGYRTPPNRAALMMLRNNPPHGPAEVRGRKVVPRSASASYLARRSTNVWAHFARPKRRQERAYTKDLAGKKLRSKNFQTKRPDLTNPTLKYQKRMAAGERPYKGPAGGFVTRRPGQKAWKGDIAHWPLRGKTPGGAARISKRVPGREPGIGAEGIGKYQGNIKGGRKKAFDVQGEGYSGNIRARRPTKGGGSVSGRAWNNNGSPIQGKTPGKGSSGIGYSGNIKAGKRTLNDQGEEYTGNIKSNRKRGFNDQGEEYTGNIKTRRPEKGGGSVSGRVWNNKNSAITGRAPHGQADIARYQGNLKAGRRQLQDQGEEYTGNIKARRPEKGGGSVSGKIWNNNNSPITGRAPSGQTKIARYQGNLKAGRRQLQDQGEEYTGNIKAKKPEQGGGSVSGKVWNNNNSPIAGSAPRGQTKMARYQGNIRAKRPEKGGGSVSGKLWNNNETPIAAKIPKTQQGGRFAGNIRVAKNRYQRNPNSPADALPVYRDKNNAGGEFQGNIRLARGNRKRNPNAADEALPGYHERNDQGGEFSGHLRLARGNHQRNPNSSRDALPVIKPSDATARAANYAKGARRNWDYIRNPSAADDALRIREPGRAFARATDYQGSIKLKRFDLFGKPGLHPDAKFVKLNKNNVPEERDMITNFKLWWARLFRKNDTQPDNLKEKEHKPRYDKGEAGMWYQ